MGLDCDICDEGNLHTFYTLDNGLEVCPLCKGKRDEWKNESKFHKEEMNKVKNEMDLYYHFRRHQEAEQKLHLTYDQLKIGLERRLYREANR
jgi:hypothetical protein